MILHYFIHRYLMQNQLQIYAELPAALHRVASCGNT